MKHGALGRGKELGPGHKKQRLLPHSEARKELGLGLVWQEVFGMGCKER